MNKEQFYEVITEQAVEISRVRKKCSAFAVAIARFEGVVTGMERERKRLIEKIIALGGEV